MIIEVAMGEPEFTIDNADQYPQILLERGKVIADYEQRKAKMSVPLILFIMFPITILIAAPGILRIMQNAHF